MSPPTWITRPRSCASSSQGETFASWSSAVTTISSPSRRVRPNARLRRKLSDVMLWPKAVSPGAQPRNVAAFSCASSTSSVVRRLVEYGAPMFALSSRRYRPMASMTSSGHCVPPGPSKNASGRSRAEKRARTAETSSAVVLTKPPRRSRSSGAAVWRSASSRRSSRAPPVRAGRAGRRRRASGRCCTSSVVSISTNAWSPSRSRFVTTPCALPELTTFTPERRAE